MEKGLEGEFDKTEKPRDLAAETIHDFMTTAQLMGYDTALQVYVKNQEVAKTYRDIKSS